MSTLSSANFTEGNIVKKNATTRSTAKRFIYSLSVYKQIRQLANNTDVTTGAVLGRQNTSSEQPPTQYGRR